MINSHIEDKAKLKKLFESRMVPDRSFKTLSRKRTPINLRQRKLLPDTTLYPSDWTYLVSNEKRPHTITYEEFKKIKIKEGDKIYFERGQIYNFVGLDLTVNNTIWGEYGAGVKPKMRGGTALTSWTSEAGGYYSTPLATAPKWVSIAGEMARQGQSTFIPVTANPGGADRTFSSATLNAFNTIEALTTAKARFTKEFNFRTSFEYTISSYN